MVGAVSHLSISSRTLNFPQFQLQEAADSLLASIDVRALLQKCECNTLQGLIRLVEASHGIRILPPLVATPTVWRLASTVADALSVSPRGMSRMQPDWPRTHKVGAPAPACLASPEP